MMLAARRPPRRAEASLPGETMSEHDHTSTTPPLLRLPLAAAGSRGGAAEGNALPALFSLPGSRDAGPAQALVPGLQVRQRWPLAAASRSAEAPRQADVPADRRLLALVADDGSTVLMRADALAEQLRRARPELVAEDGAIDLARLRPRTPQSRGLGEWLWREACELVLPQDTLAQKIRDELGGQLADAAAQALSLAGARRLMELVEAQGAPRKGLYAWSGGALQPQDRCADAHAPALAQVGPGRPMLLFVHGTGSHTLGSFGELAASASWAALRQAFGQRVFGFEHATFSQSPVANALELLQLLPDGAELCLVSHSRGGLVADLLCLATDPATPEGAGFDALVADWARRAADDGRAAEWAEQGRAEQAQLRALAGLLRAKRLRVQRLVRVAAPARGTTLLSDNLDLFLSGLLGLVRQFGAWSAGALAGVLATPAAAAAARQAADQGLQFLARVVLEIADKRLDARVVPGIEAMLPEAPLGTLLARARRRPEVRLAVVAGDVEGGGLGERLGLMFTDWMFFDRSPNDLVVNTASMYGGLASQQREAARALFVQGPAVNHFRYFLDSTRCAGVPLPQAMLAWLQADDPLQQAPWQPLLPPPEARSMPAASRAAVGPKPMLVLLPGIMGSHIATAQGDRIWLDPLDLARGRLSRIAMPAPGQADGLLDLAYGTLAERLAASHEVTRFDYDWRQPIAELGQRLRGRLRALLDDPARRERPLHLLAHSMGGLVVRAALAAEPGLWDELVARGGRLVTLGTPHHGSHLFVQTLLGLSDTVRLLARADLVNPMQTVLDIIAGFPGALHLLPAPGFVDAGAALPQALADDHYQSATWQAYKAINNDFWFGRQLGGLPTPALLAQAAAFWQQVGDTRWVTRHPERIAHVHGQADSTPCGLLAQLDARGQRRGLTLLETPQGDGSVSWASGRLRDLPESRQWLMPVDHQALAGTPAFFDEIEALLLQGRPLRLAPLPQSRGEAAPLRQRRPGPPPAYPSDDELVGALLGARPAPLPQPVQRRQRLVLRVRAMDVRFVNRPVLCGHYQGDPISGAEALIDAHLVDHALSRRLRMGIHAGALGSASVVLMPRSAAEREQGLGRGALVVGLGAMGGLGIEALADTVRAGVLRLLMHAQDRRTEDLAGSEAPGLVPLRLASLLLGSNSAARMGLDDSVRAVVLGVLRANRDMAATATTPQAPLAQIGELELVEVYRDAAISAAEAVAELPGQLRRELALFDAELAVDQELAFGKGVRDRLRLSQGSDYWPRLEVSDADREDTDCGADCFAVRLRHNVPPDALRQLLSLYGTPAQASAAVSGVPVPPVLDLPPLQRDADRLRFVYMGERALAAAQTEQRQPGLVEQLVAQAIGAGELTSWRPGEGIGRTLFQLLLPVELKAQWRRARQLILVVDEATANIPWELLEDADRPLIANTQLVRQLRSARFRRDPVPVDARSALVIGNPDTHGFYRQFNSLPAPADAEDRLPSLSGAEDEAAMVSEVLAGGGYDLTPLPPGARAPQVFQALFARPHRVLVVAAHGVHGLRGADGQWRSGVVLSDGLLLTAAEVGRLEQVPELVFLDCCQLGRIGSGAGASQRLAYSLARELIEIGVRCVVAAGWAVDDGAALTFSRRFFQAMVREGESFADALQAARQQCLAEHPGLNTWGAYQAYGDPQFRLMRSPPSQAATAVAPLRAPEELLRWLQQRALEVARGAGGAPDLPGLGEAVRQRLAQVPAGWAQRPDVLHAIGALYAEAGGHELAREPLLAAVAAQRADGVVPISALELLANCESRSAGQMLDGEPDAATVQRAGQRLQQALHRLQMLQAVTADDPGAAQDATEAERAELLAGTLKRQLRWLQASGQTDWAVLRPVAVAARDAYRRAEVATAPEDFEAYAVINRLQLDGVLEPPADAQVEAELANALARAAEAAARQRWDIIAAPDGALAGWLLRLPQRPRPSVRDYTLALDAMRASPRERDSVLRQLELLQLLLQASERADDAAQLAELRRGLGVSTAPAVAAASATATDPARRATPRKAAPRKASTQPPKRRR